MKDNETITAQNKALSQREQELQDRLDVLEKDYQLFADAQENADKQATTLATLQAAYDKQRMVALSAEKNFFQLAKHILSLSGDNATITELKSDVMLRIEEMKKQ